MKSIYIQRKRSKGFNLQAQSPDGREVVSCTRPGKFGNYFIADVDIVAGAYQVTMYDSPKSKEWFGSKLDALKESINLYARLWNTDHGKRAIRHHLSGKHLACWCAPGAPCHVQDVLLPIINGEEPRDYNV